MPTILNKFIKMSNINRVGKEDPSHPKRDREGYGKPVAGSLTEARGQKANIHVYKEIMELCYVIDSEGEIYAEKSPQLKVIPFGQLFNIYARINNKLVGLLLRARKYHVLDFEGEMLFQRRDDDVPIIMLKTIDEIKSIFYGNIDEVQKNVHSDPKPTDVLLK